MHESLLTFVKKRQRYLCRKLYLRTCLFAGTTWLAASNKRVDWTINLKYKIEVFCQGNLAAYVTSYSPFIFSVFSSSQVTVRNIPATFFTSLRFSHHRTNKAPNFLILANKVVKLLMFLNTCQSVKPTSNQFSTKELLIFDCVQQKDYGTPNLWGAFSHSLLQVYISACPFLLQNMVGTFSSIYR